MDSILLPECANLPAPHINEHNINHADTGRTYLSGKTDREDKNRFHNNTHSEFSHNLSSLLKDNNNTSVEFINNSDEGTSYINIIDTTTKEIVRTFPTEEMREVLEKLSEHLGNYLDFNI